MTVQRSPESSTATSAATPAKLVKPVATAVATKANGNHRISNELHQKISKLTRSIAAAAADSPPLTASATTAASATKFKRTLPLGEIKQRSSFNLDDRPHSYLKFNDLKVRCFFTLFDFFVGNTLIIKY